MGLFNKDIKNDNKVSNTHKAIEEKRNNRLYLVDYENVSDAGLVGVNKLSAKDFVIIFYGSRVKSIDYESHIAITDSTANIEEMKAEKTAKNYLDFQLTTYLGYKLGQNSYSEIYVISNDSGFDAVVDFWSQRGYSIKRQEAIVVTKKSTKEQANNTRKNRYFEFKGEKKTLSQLADEYNIEYRLLRERVVIQNWDLERALTAPKMTPSEARACREVKRDKTTGRFIKTEVA